MNPNGFFFVSETGALDVARNHAGSPNARFPLGNGGALFMSHPAYRVRAEEGNERYEYFFPMDDSQTVMLIDRWTDQTALDARHKTPMMAEIAEMLNIGNDTVKRTLKRNNVELRKRWEYPKNR